MVEAETESELISVLRANTIRIKELKDMNDELTWKYVHRKASDPTQIAETLDTISKYLAKYYDSYSDFIDLCKANLTMVPVYETIFQMSEYHTRIKYDTVLYEWAGKRVMYVRASKNWEHYHKSCDYWNGFSFESFDFDDLQNPSYPWWKTETDFLLMDHLEHQIELSASKRRSKPSFSEHVRGIRDQYKLLAALFDQSDYSHSVIGDGKIPGVYRFLPQSIDPPRSVTGLSDDTNDSRQSWDD
jgi:hypothetical protein